MVTKNMIAWQRISTFYFKTFFAFIPIILLTLSIGSVKAQTKQAFLVGISEYHSLESKSLNDEWPNIHGANDVELIGATLKQQGFIITTIKNEAANADEIRTKLKNFASCCNIGDIIYLHFSCHGQPVEDLDGDEEDEWDEALIPVDAQKEYQEGRYTGENHITDDELNSYLRTIRENVGSGGMVYVVIDACHAGSSYRGDEKEDSVIIRGTDKGFSMSNKPYVPRIDKRGKIKIEESSSMANICILEACRSYQVNSEIIEEGTFYGSLSYYVNKTLQSIKLDLDISWTHKVVQLMNQDERLVRQNVVIETSL